MYDVGDAVPLSLAIKDASGNPANATLVTLTITLPDGTTTAPAVTNPSTGTYVAAFATTQAGRHKVAWVATGTNATAQSDVFEVVALDPGFIISLAQARTAIGKPAADTSKDEDLRTYLAGIVPVLEDICGPIVPQPFDEWHDGGAATVKTLKSPLLSVASVTESWGAFTRTLTAQPLNGSSFDAYGYTVDLKTGLLHRRISGRVGKFAPGRMNIRVVGQVGRTQPIGQNIVLAARRLLRHLWQSEQQGPRPNMGSPEATVTTPSGFAVPRAVIELCGADVRIPGIL